MKQNVSPVMIAVVVLVVLAVVGFFYMRANNVAGAREGDKSYQMPPDVGKSLSQVMGGKSGQTAPPAGNTGPSAPRTLPGAGGGGMPTGPMTGPGAR